MNQNLKRFDLIDHHLYWYGGVNATLLSQILGLTRQNVSLLMREFKASRPLGHVEYDSSLKMHIPGPAFALGKRFIQTAHLFLDHLRGQEMIQRYRDEVSWDPEDDLLFDDLDRYGRMEPRGEIVRQITRCLKRKQLLRIQYQSRRKSDQRVISPNRIIYAVDRYHLRAFCHTKGGYRDFVLTRILEAEPMDQAALESLGMNLSWVSDEHDRKWHEARELVLQPNPELDPEVIKTLLRDYPVQDGKLVLQCNAVTEPYLEIKFAKPDFAKRIPQWVRADAKGVEGTS